MYDGIQTFFFCLANNTIDMRKVIENKHFKNCTHSVFIIIDTFCNCIMCTNIYCIWIYFRHISVKERMKLPSMWYMV